MEDNKLSEDCNCNRKLVYLYKLCFIITSLDLVNEDPGSIQVILTFDGNDATVSLKKKEDLETGVHLSILATPEAMTEKLKTSPIEIQIVGDRDGIIGKRNFIHIKPNLVKFAWKNIQNL